MLMNSSVDQRRYPVERHRGRHRQRSGTITAAGGALHLTGTVASGPAFTIDTANASTLSIENTATARCLFQAV